jgi:uncharacterized protein (DUF433 family)
MIIPTELAAVLKSDPAIRAGRLCFAGTRVPVEALLDYVNTGDSLDSFLRGNANVSRDQALAVLAWQDKTSKEALGLDLAD